MKLALTIEGCKNSCATKNISFHSYVMNIHNFDPKPVHVLHNPAMNRVVLPQGLTFFDCGGYSNRKENATHQCVNLCQWYVPWCVPGRFGSLFLVTAVKHNVLIKLKEDY